MAKTEETRLRKGDTIKCADAEECVRTMSIWKEWNLSIFLNIMKLQSKH